MDNSDSIAACGLLCHECRIYQARGDPKIARDVADWFKREQEVDVQPEQVICEGCLGDRSQHWSPDCWILKCCVDDRGLENCSYCSDFPCPRLEEWSRESEGYGTALKRLENMRPPKR